MSAAPKKKAGGPRKSPVSLTPEIQARICKGLSLGKSLASVLKAPGMPSVGAYMDKCHADGSWNADYAGARARGLAVRGEGILDLADTATPENVNVVRLKVDTLKWTLSKQLPKVYGDRIALEDITPIENRPLNAFEEARLIMFALALGAREAPKTHLLPAPSSAPVTEGPSAEHSGEKVVDSAPTHTSTHEIGEEPEPILDSERGRKLVSPRPGEVQYEQGIAREEYPGIPRLPWRRSQ